MKGKQRKVGQHGCESLPSFSPYSGGRDVNSYAPPLSDCCLMYVEQPLYFMAVSAMRWLRDGGEGRLRGSSRRREEPNPPGPGGSAAASGHDGGRLAATTHE